MHIKQFRDNSRNTSCAVTCRSTLSGPVLQGKMATFTNSAGYTRDPNRNILVGDQ
jgi:hypothetical protein